MVSAKFVVNRISDMGWATEVELVPDYAHGRNKEWAAATPSGMIRLTVKNTLATEQFRAPTHPLPDETAARFTNMEPKTPTETGRAKVVLFLDEDDPLLAQLGL